MCTIFELAHDERGIIWPEAIAPFQVYLLALNQDKEADKLYEALKTAGVEVLYNDLDLGMGEKMADADLIGCPYRILISPKSVAGGGAEIKRRNSTESVIVDLKKVVDYLKK